MIPGFIASLTNVRNINLIMMAVVVAGQSISRLCSRLGPFEAI